MTYLDEKTTGANIGLAIWRLKCFYETFVQGSTLGILLNFCAKNPPHRQAAKIKYNNQNAKKHNNSYIFNLHIFVILLPIILKFNKIHNKQKLKRAVEIVNIKNYMEFRYF
jgi:hypothetical protein